MSGGNSSLILNKEELYQLLVEVNADQTKIIKQELSLTVHTIADKVDVNTKKIQELENKVVQLERKTRRKNIVVFGLEISDQSVIHQETLSKINNLLELNFVPDDISNIYQLKKSGESAAPIIIELVSQLKKNIIFQNISKLKGSGIAITHDLSYEDRQKHKLLFIHLKKARNQKLSARIVGDKLEINNKLFTVDQLSKDCDSDSDIELSDNNPPEEEKSQQSSVPEKSKDCNSKRPITRAKNSKNYK